ncbi:MAG: hypothetical protein ACEY3J_02100 [Arsenophonus sp.]
MAFSLNLKSDLIFFSLYLIEKACKYGVNGKIIEFSCEINQGAID